MESIISILILTGVVIIFHFVIKDIKETNKRKRILMYKKMKEKHGEEISPEEEEKDSNAKKKHQTVQKNKTIDEKQKTKENSTKKKSQPIQKNKSIDKKQKTKENSIYNQYYRERKTREEIKGQDGEELIVDKLKTIPGYARILTNIYIPKKNNPKETTEIDVLYICKSGIFVIESKNFSGFIVGNEFQKNWKQYFRKDLKYEFYNPIMQNYHHIINLKDITRNLGNYPHFSLIVFGDDCKLSVNSETKVINLRDMKDTINSFEDKNAINEKQIDELHSFLSQFSEVSQEVKRNHNNNITKRYKKRPIDFRL